MTLAIDQSKPSPNHLPRGGVRISMLVLHATVGSAKSALDWLTNPATRVSSHYLIDKTGHIYQLVQDDQIAWHAGRSRWHGVTNINAMSLGIELENANDGRDPYPAVQLRMCHDLCRAKIFRYNIERGDVVRHLDIAVPRGRKTDPAPPAFPWPSFADDLYSDDLSRPLAHYRVKQAVTGGAMIRAYPSKSAATMGRLKAGDGWIGEPVEGQTVTLDGFGSSSIWIRGLEGRVVWSGLLERVKES